MEPGIRVLRGPDWCYANHDGGPGCLGTVVKFLSNNRVVVVWDIGTQTTCRAGSQGAFDLRLYDNAQIGVKQVICDGDCLDTDDNNLYGFRWKDLKSEDRDQCTLCYIKDMGEVDHAYVRYTTKRSLVETVEPRSRSRRIPLVGIFPGAEVMKSAVEAEASTGIVKEFVNIQDSYRGAVTVEWKNGPKRLKLDEHGTDNDDSSKDDEEEELPIYRVGANGKVELKLIAPSPEKRHVYINHLPVLDLTMPVDIEFKAGDKVRMDLHLETFKALQNEYGGWADGMESIMGEEGIIDRVLDEGRRLATVKFGNRVCRALYLNTLTKLRRFSAGDYVRIIDDVSMVRKAQAAHGGWQDSLKSVLGHVGRIKRVDTSGDVFLVVEDHTYVFNQSCIKPLKDEEMQAYLRINPYGSMPYVPSTTTFGRVPAEARRKCAPGQSIGIGVRVVRGPDWKVDFENQDGGEGHLGSIVEIGGQRDSDFPENCVMVQWDMGEKDLYRAGYQNAYDLRIYDNAGIGVKHNAQCSECRAVDICGLIWKCSDCSDVTLCLECYSSDRHDINHQFIRKVCPEDNGVKMPKRSISKKLTAKGIFERSKIKRGPNWRWQNQDGGPDKSGQVIAIVNFSPDTDHDAVEVTWENGYTNVYRLGYKGSLDVQCVKAASGGFYYRDHLPTLKLDKGTVQQSEPSEEAAQGAVGGEGRFKEGDRVKIEMDVDLLRTIEKERGSWNDAMGQCIGETGTVKLSNVEGDITVDFGSAGIWTFSEMALIKVKEFVPGEIVQVNSNVETVRKIQVDTVGWHELMTRVVGKKGKVEEIDEDGDIQVSFGEYTWTFNPECLMEATGEPDSVSYDLTKKVEEKKQEEPVNEETKTDDKKINDIFDAIDKGDNDAVIRLIRRNSSLLKEKYQGKAPIHWACYKGELGIVQTLFSTDASLAELREMTDDDGNTPLLSAVIGRQLDVVKTLIDFGANKEAENKSHHKSVNLAVGNKDADLLRVLRDNNFDVNHKVWLENQKESDKNVWLENQNESDTKDQMEQSAVFDAILSDNKEIAKIVLEWPGVDVKYVDNLKFSPFFIACRKGDIGIVHQLLQMAPDELNSAKETDGFTGLHIAALNGKTQLVQYLLVQNGIQFDIPSSDGRTPLHIGCGEGHFEIVKLLLDNGADRKAVDKNGRNCLHLCLLVQEEQEKNKTTEKMIQLAEFLIKNGVDYELKDYTGKTPVELASDAVGPLVQQIIDKRNQEKQPTRSPFGKIQMNNPMSQSMYAGQSASPFQSPQRPQFQGQAPGIQAFVSPQGQGQPRMSQSMIIPSKGGQGQGQFTGQSPVRKNLPQTCPSCEDEPPTYILMPCEHAMCADCAPKMKMKKKVCPECRCDVENMIKIFT